jgi:hypothetical protein
MSNPLLSPAENAALTALRSNGAALLDSTVSSANALLDRVDWNKAFIRVAIVLNAVGVLYVGYVYSIYAAYFGVSALAFIGQFLIGLFFMACVVSSTDGLQVMLASIGMFILANSF